MILNNKSAHAIPAIICLSGLDPSGGAGLQADIETMAALNCHALPIATCLTVQNTRKVNTVIATPDRIIRDQFQCLLDDIEVAAIKIGLLPDIATVDCIYDLIRNTNKPVILDPILRAGSGDTLNSAELGTHLFEKLLPHVSVLTPNLPEARSLAQTQDPDMAAESLLSTGCRSVVISGTHEPGHEIIHRYYTLDKPATLFKYERLPGEYHGSGCTLSSAIASLLAHQLAPGMAINGALDYTWNTLKNGYTIGHGQSIPQRIKTPVCNP